MILEAHFLKTVESNVSISRTHAGPDVVWLTTNETADAGHGLAGAPVDKTAIRFTVDLPAREVHKWKEWARSQGSSNSLIQSLAAAGGAGSWRVTTKPIPIENWVEVRRMTTDEVLVDRELLKRVLKLDD